MTQMTTTVTAEQVLARLDAEADVPVLTGEPQPQGDLLVLPADGLVPDATHPIPTDGVPLLQGQGGHTHLLLGRASWTPGQAGAQTLGVLTVPDQSVAWIAHGDGTPASALSRDADHAMLGVGPGTYVLRRQREQADIVAYVAD